MHRVKEKKENQQGRLCVSRTELPALLGCGQFTADLLSKEAEARIYIGKRVLVYVPKLEKYLQTLVE